MAQELIKIYKDIKKIRDYLIKEGKRRYKGDTCQSKLQETEKILSNLEETVGKFTKLITAGTLGQSDIKKGQKAIDNIQLLYEEIKTLCVPLEESNSGSESDSDWKEFDTMAVFDLKTAANLLPVMNDDELVTLQLIDSIELYESMLKDGDKIHLVNFVLKTRLSYGAKLRMSASYTTVTSMVTDMRKHLLTRKSDTALQTRLQNARQNNRSISDFGEEIERLFADLTIAQADGDLKKYEVLKPINERTAIKRFSDGLRDHRLSTIIAARNFTSLKDAIRSALDEEVTSPAPPVLQYHQRGRSNVRGRGARGNRGYYHRGRNSQPQTHNYRQNSHTGNYNTFRGTRYMRGTRGTNMRQSRSGYVPHKVHWASNEQSKHETSDTDQQNLNQFFRS